MAEKDILGRDSAASVTGITGYAGGRDNTGDICYTDYGDKGHTEVVLTRGVPRERMHDFADALWRGLFHGGERSDHVNRGGEYRAALGFPGGLAGDPALAAVWASAQSGPTVATLVAGEGDESDSLGTRTIHVYDSNVFTFHQAELYHQFHDYLQPYRKVLERDGRLRPTRCPSELEATFRQPLMIVLLTLGSLAVCCCCGCCLWKRCSHAEQGHKVGDYP